MPSQETLPGAPSVTKVKLEVPSLGTITGLCFDNSICQYLGVPYADVPGRFRRSVPASEPWPKRTWDGTRLGSYCPQPGRGAYPIVAPARTWVTDPGMDELNCLNLNVNVPHRPDESASAPPLPVMVHFHGGAFTWSTGSAAIYDGRTLTAIAERDLDRPTIIVTLNYRLGAFGFLAGRDLQAYRESCGETGVGNYGVWDQVLALRWVKSHIREFGGDPDRVTVFGQSAGGVSIHTHMLRNEQLFSSAIMQSGTVTLCGIMDVDEYQKLYEKLLVQLGISTSLPADQRVARLLEASPESLIGATKNVLRVLCQTWRLCDDGVILPGGIPRYLDYDKFQVPDWCHEVMIGDCTHESIIWMDPYMRITAEEILSRMNSFFGPKKAAVIAQMYGLTPELSQPEAFRIFENMTSDGMYIMKNYFATKSVPRVYAYHFDVPQRWEGKRWCGLAHHSYDNVMVWSILRNSLPLLHQEISAKMAEAWLRFANGEAPWERFSDSQRWMVIEETGLKMKNRQEDEKRGYWRFDQLHEQGLLADLGYFSDDMCLITSELLS